MVNKDQIVSLYHHLLMLDNDTDKEKQWIETRQPSALGLSTIHFHILSYLERYPNSLAKEIAEDLGILRGTLSKRLAVLERRKMLVAYQDAADARSKHYQLTQLGENVAKTHDQLLQMKNKMLKSHLNQFSESELETIRQFLKTFNNAEQHDKY